jgi:serine/threonine protein kinase
MSIESWMMGVRRVSMLPTEVQPVLLGVLDYSIDDQIFLWQETVSSGLGHLSLDYYRSYDASSYKPHVFFDHWTRIFELLPPELIVRCSTMTPGSVHERLTDHYVAFSGDNRTECDHGDAVWFSPACRANTSECVPLLLQYGAEMAMQFSYFYTMPLAIVVVDQGAANYREYYAAVRASRVLFSWFFPQENLVDSEGRFPALLNFPRTNQEEWIQRVYRTGNANLRPRNYAWRRLPALDRRAAFLGARVTAQDQDVEAWMRRSRRLQDAGADPAAASRQIACEWLAGRPAAWAPWIPAACPAGAFVDPTLTQCLPCPAGSSCAGGERPPIACPLGFFCPAASAAAVPCPEGRTTGGPAAAASARDCDACAATHLPAGGACVPAALVFPAVLVPLAALVVAAWVLLRRRREAEERAAWRVKAKELVFADPPQVLGGGSQGVVLAATYRGTPVAVKVFHVRDTDGDGLLAFAGRRAAGAAGMDASVHSSAVNAASAVASAAAAAAAAAAGWGGDGGKGRRTMSSRGAYRQLKADVAALTAIRHPCIANVMGVADLRGGAAGGGAGLCVVMEYMELGSLWDFLHGRAFRVQADTVLGVLQGVAQGMRFLHEAQPPLLHGDLKSSNVLVDRSFLAKISDFGLAAYTRGRGAAPALTEALYWTAPECLPAAGAGRGGPCSVRADVYSFGVIMHECLTRRSPHDGAGDPPAVLEAVRRGERALAPPPGCGVAAAALLSDCLQHEPGRRPPFAELDRRLAALEVAQLATPGMEGAAGSYSHRSKVLTARRAMTRMASAPMHRSCDALVAEVLTEGAAEALLRGEKVPPERRDMVTMHFSDIVGFTTLSAGMPAEMVRAGRQRRARGGGCGVGESGCGSRLAGVGAGEGFSWTRRTVPWAVD